MTQVAPEIQQRMVVRMWLQRPVARRRPENTFEFLANLLINHHDLVPPHPDDPYLRIKEWIRPHVEKSEAERLLESGR